VPDYRSGEDVNDERGVTPARACAYVRKIRHPQFIRPSRVIAAFYKISGTYGLSVRDTASDIAKFQIHD
jgi:hypothetical protein